MSEHISLDLDHLEARIARLETDGDAGGLAAIARLLPDEMRARARAAEEVSRLRERLHQANSRAAGAELTLADIAEQIKLYFEKRPV